MLRLRIRRAVRRAPLALALAALLAPATACTREEAQAAPTQSVAVARQDIVVDVEATGVVTPINAVEVRSKASGQITRMAVQTGAQVKAGDLLARIDPRDPQSRFDQARAAVNAATAQASVTRAQQERNRALLAQGVITAPESEASRLAYANAQAQLASARTQLDLARIALEDVTIRAPSAGTVIARNVAEGQVITSSTNSPSGGTVLLQLADLSVVYDSTLVNESDIGKVRPGQPATVTVDAYPGRTFRGVVEKVEPRATVQQSVTFFPVLIRIDNRDGALMPGMNSDVSVLVDERRDVLAVPIDAVRPLREAATAATALGVDPEVVRQAVQAARGGGRARQGDTGAGATAVPATGAAAPAGRGDSAARGGGRAGRGGRGGGAGRSGGGGATTRAVVFVRAGTGFQPRVVTLGLSNYDFAEVRDGLRPGEQVALVSAAVLQQSRTERQQQLRSRSGLPGMGGGGAGGGGGRGGSGGGGGGGGGGGRGGS